VVDDCVRTDSTPIEIGERGISWLVGPEFPLRNFGHELDLALYAALWVGWVVSKSARGIVKKIELPLPNWLSAQIVPP
jgi:hypothetical protein